MSSITNEDYQSLLKVLSSFVMSGLEDVVNFEDHSDEIREEIIKASLKALEISSVITSKFFNTETFDHEKLKKVSEALSNNHFEEATTIVNN